MPYIAASNSQSEYDLLKEKHSISEKSSAELSDTPPEVGRGAEEADQDPESCVSDKLQGDEIHSEQTQNIIASDGQKPKKQIDLPLAVKLASSGVLALPSSEYDLRELLSFPNESTHAYSYNPLSPNSLAVRLRILKRSLEIMIRNPSLLHEHHTDNHLRVRTPNGSRVEFSFSDRGSRDTLSRPDLKKIFSQDSMVPLSKSKLTNASSAALSALVNSNGQSNVNLPDSHQLLSRHLSSFQLGSPSSQRSTNSPSIILRDTPNSTSSNSPRTSVDESATSSDFEAASHQESGSLYMAKSNSSSEYLANKSDLVSLLDILNETLENNSSEKASNLHMISLLNYNKLSLDVDHVGDNVSNAHSDKHEETLKKNLLESLAQPFFESFNPEVIPEEVEELNSTDEDKLINDPLALAAPRTGPESNRILHTFVSGKNSSPQAIFTCLQQYPWQFKAANDLACLIFGISKNALRALTLLDLIHSDSRNFVLNKIMSTENQELVFTGEIVGIIQPGDASSQLVWSSIWAKRKNGLIVCVFEKVPCDYMDVLLDLEDFSVDSILGGESLKLAKDEETQQQQLPVSPTTGDYVPKKKSVKFTNEIHDVNVLSKSLAHLINDVQEGKVFSKDDDLLPMSIRVSNNINKVRYFTLNHLTYNIPCAVSSSILESEMKLKIHSLPYQAGIFIINSNDYSLISFNKSVSKNMFGLHAKELVGKKVTKIVPSFSELLDFIRLKYPNLDVTLPKNKGLVLTEHFFRKIQAEISNGAESFYNSIGINAIHRDGSIIKVDIQLRVMDSSNALLWITHSRDVVFENYTTNPSQLRMLKENELAVVGSGSSSEASSKRPSRKIHVNDFQALKENLKLDGSTVGNNSDTGKQHQPNIEEPPDTPTDENPKRNSICDISDLDEQLAAKLEIAKKYSQDKSQFVKDDNFKLDEDLILSLTSTSPRPDSDAPTFAKSNPAATYSDHRTEEGTVFLTTPEHNIGALKHIKTFSDFVVLQKMGEGAYGKVDLCMHKKDKYVVVIKLIFKERILVDTWVRDRKLGTIPSEIQIMAALNKKPHENILVLLDFFEDDDYYYIETPIHGTTGSIDLFDLIELKTNMTEHEAKLIFKQVVSGIKHLHDNGIVHRDIKDENIIVDNKGCVKLIDFGSAAYVKSGPFDVFVGTIDYAAPEVLGGEPYEGKPQDIWALGVLLYTIIFKENPFYNIDEILDGDLRISSSSGVSEDCLVLIQKILNRSIPKRPSVDDIANDKWLEV